MIPIERTQNRIIEALQLCEGGMNLGALAEECEISKRQTERHLRMLVPAGKLVAVPVDTPEQTRIFGTQSKYYYIHPDHINKHPNPKPYVPPPAQFCAEVKATSEVWRVSPENITEHGAKQAHINLARHMARLLMYERGKSVLEIATAFKNAEETIEKSIFEAAPRYLEENYMGCAYKLKQAREFLDRREDVV